MDDSVLGGAFFLNKRLKGGVNREEVEKSLV
jgi:hypothetical protein